MMTDSTNDNLGHNHPRGAGDLVCRCECQGLEVPAWHVTEAGREAIQEAILRSRQEILA